VRLSPLAILILSVTMQLDAAQTAVPLSPNELFTKASAPVFVVVVADEHGKPIALGSAVAIGPDELVTNKHVVSDGSKYWVRQGDKTWSATASAISPEEDLCILKVEGLNVDVRPAIRSVDTLVIGERAYAIGAPEGFELSISEGLISGIRKESFGFVIQTTAAISHGSSGGGVFDSKGNLIGITTFTLDNAQQLNFAMPAEDIKGLQQQSQKVTAAAWTALGDEIMKGRG